MNNLPVCLIDFETRSKLDVRDVGAWRYAEHPSTEILCMSYRFGREKAKLWIPDLPFPQRILDHIEKGGMFEAHFVQFERVIWYFILHKLYGLPMPFRWKDTLAACAYKGIPLKLEDAGKALNLAIQKDRRGKYLISQLCVPKKPTKKEPNRKYREDWVLYQELYDYCIQDNDSELCLSDTLGDLPPPEYKIWCLDQRINQRGILVDIEAVNSALEVIENYELKLNKELFEITKGIVERSSQRDRVLGWLRANGLPYLENLTKETLEHLLQKDKNGRYTGLGGLDKNTIRVLEIRAQLAKASTKKLQRMKKTASSDNRIRGMLQYHGAATGRWAGRLAQPHNIPRPLQKYKKENLEEIITQIKRRDIDVLEYLYDNPMDVISSSLRGMFIAAQGKVLRVCDFSAIEARVTFWVADCTTGLEVFHKSDRGESEDIYCVTASDLVGFEVKKKQHGEERQLGKITVLGCGYQMGWPKLQTQAAKDYNVILSDDDAEKMVTLYRTKYKEVKDFWYGIEEAAMQTVRTGESYGYRRIVYEYVIDKAGSWLTCILPNGRRLWYLNPRIKNKMMPWGKRKDVLFYDGRDNKKSGAWGEVPTYGGMLTENIVQAISRDLMVESMIRVEKEGYPIILTVHDEVIAEVDKNYGSQEHYEHLMAIPPPWAHGCPIAVEGGAITRYRKL